MKVTSFQEQTLGQLTEAISDWFTDHPSATVVAMSHSQGDGGSYTVLIIYND